MRVVAGVAIDGVVPLAAADEVVSIAPVHDVVSLVSVQVVVPGASVDGVIAVEAADEVVAVAAEHRVVPGVAVDGVVSRARVEGVSARSPCEDVIAAKAGEGVVARAAEQAVRAIVAGLAGAGGRRQVGPQGLEAPVVAAPVEHVDPAVAVHVAHGQHVAGSGVGQPIRQAYEIPRPVVQQHRRRPAAGGEHDVGVAVAVHVDDLRAVDPRAGRGERAGVAQDPGCGLIAERAVAVVDEKLQRALAIGPERHVEHEIGPAVAVQVGRLGVDDDRLSPRLRSGQNRPDRLEVAGAVVQHDLGCRDRGRVRNQLAVRPQEEVELAVPVRVEQQACGVEAVRGVRDRRVQPRGVDREMACSVVDQEIGPAPAEVADEQVRRAISVDVSRRGVGRVVAVGGQARRGVHINAPAR